MARILFTTTLGGSSWAGSEVLWFESAKHLSSQGHEVAVVLPHGLNTEKIIHQVEAVGISTLSHAFDRLRSASVRIHRRLEPGRPTSLAPAVWHTDRLKAIYSRTNADG